MRPIFRALLISLLVIIVAAVAFTYMSGSAAWRYAGRPDATVGTSGSVNIDKARATGAELGEKAAVATAKAKETMAEASVTGKIKAKMALDDSVKARSIDVTTEGTTVTLTGHVRSAAEHDRAVALARETAGVERVVDRLVIEP